MGNDSGERGALTERDGGCVHTVDDDREVFVCTSFRAWQKRLAEKENSDV